jgi:regulator of protease activity HflC (stomatin/prohibitin superfamily)
MAVDLNLVTIGVAALFLIIFLSSSIRIVSEWERGVILRIGRVQAGARGPGLFFLVPVLDRLIKVSLQEVAMNVPPQDVITRDNVTVRVDAVLYFKVVDPVRAVVTIQNYLFATSQIAQTTLRSVCGTAELDEVLGERDRLNAQIRAIVDEHTEPWGVQVRSVEIKDVSLPQEIQRAMGRQAEAERDRRAKIINAEGEFQSAQRLADAAEVIEKRPIAYQLRLLQTVTEVAAEKNSTLVLPIPIELLGPYRAAFGEATAANNTPVGDGRRDPGPVNVPTT